MTNDNDRPQNDDLPDGWVWTTVEELAESIQYGHTESANSEPVGPKFLRITDIQDGQVNWDAVPYCRCSEEEHEKYRLQPGDIVFARTGATTGKSFLISNCPDAVFASYLIRLRISPHVYNRYFAWFLETPEYWSQIMRVRKGSAQPGVNATILATLRLPIAPLAEQHRIVAKIEEHFTRLEAGVAALKRAQANLKRYKASVLKAACEGKLVEQNPSDEPASELLKRILAERQAKWASDLRAKGKDPQKAKYEEPKSPDIDELPELPSGWCWTTIEQIADETLIGLDRGRAEQSVEQALNQFPYIKMNNVSMDGRVDLDDVVYVPANGTEVEKFSVRDGDLLFNTRNSVELVGKVGIVNQPLPNTLYNNNLMRIRTSLAALPQFVCHQMCSHDFRMRMELVKKSTTNVAAVYAKDLFPLPLALPPLAEQRRIVAEVERRLSVVQELEGTFTANLARAERLRQSILKRAFEGRLV